MSTAGYDLCPLSCPLSAWQEPPKTVQSVNELKDPGGVAGTFWPEQGLSVRERWLTVWRWCCSTHAEVCCVIVMGVWWNVVEVMVCPSVLSRLCCNSGIVRGLPVGLWWSVKISWGMAIL